MTAPSENDCSDAREILRDIPIPASLRSAEEFARNAYRRVIAEQVSVAALVVILFVAARRAIRRGRPDLTEE